MNDNRCEANGPLPFARHISRPGEASSSKRDDLVNSQVPQPIFLVSSG